MWLKSIYAARLAIEMLIIVEAFESWYFSHVRRESAGASSSTTADGYPPQALVLLLRKPRAKL
jgi:hypothetical protein